MTVSVGYASVHPQPGGYEDQLKAPDGAVYEAKRTGRNRIARAEG